MKTTAACFIVAFSGFCGLAGRADAQSVDVTVHQTGNRVTIDVTAQVPLRRDVVWAVLTDYEHMPEFVSAIKSSTVLSRQGNLLQVQQSGEARRGFLHFSFSTVRSVELIGDREIASHLLHGDFKSYDFTTRLSGDPAGPTTIVHHGDYVPDRWVPPVVGPALIEAETRKQYGEMFAEMRRRQSQSPAAPR